MGWQEGQAVGKRQRTSTTKTNSATVSSEGLRVVKRADGLGLGAKHSSAFMVSAENHPVDSFASLLQKLKQEHASSEKQEGKIRRSSKKKKKNKSSSASSSSDGDSQAKTSQKTVAVLPTNRLTHARVRQAKFQEKSAEDMKCIFAGGGSGSSMTSTTLNTSSSLNVEAAASRKEKKRKQGKDSDKLESSKRKKKSNR